MKAIGLILVGVVIGVLLVAGVMAYMVIHDKPTTTETANIDSVRKHADAVLAGKGRTDSHRGGGNFIKSWIHEFIDSLNNIFILPPY